MLSRRCISRSTTTAYMPSLPPKCSYTTGLDTPACAAITSIEEIAAQAGVSKPVVYEHFGGKEGMYAVVVDREMQRLLSMVTASLADGLYRQKLEGAAMAFLEYIED